MLNWLDPIGLPPLLLATIDLWQTLFVKTMGVGFWVLGKPSPRVLYHRKAPIPNACEHYSNIFMVREGKVHLHPLHDWLRNCLPCITNVRGEPVISVMAAGWFCEKSGCIGKVEDVKLVLFLWNKEWISTGNHFEEEDFYVDELWNRQISYGLIHLGPDIMWF